MQLCQISQMGNVNTHHWLFFGSMNATRYSASDVATLKKNEWAKGKVKGRLWSSLHITVLPIHHKLWVCKSEREKENILPEFEEGAESTVHSFPLKSLFLLYPQVLREAKADAGKCQRLPSADIDAAPLKLRVRSCEIDYHERIETIETESEIKTKLFVHKLLNTYEEE